MQATIPGETKEGIGVDVVDNNSSKHEITIEKESNEIIYHDCSAYADKATERNDIDNEHNNQARRFAKYYVYRERGYDTTDPRRNPDRIAAVTLALGSLSPETLLEYLGDSYQQLAHLQHGDEPVVDTAEIPDNTIVWVTQDIAVGLDDETTSHLDDALATHGVLEALEETPAGDGDLETVIREALADHDVDIQSVGDAIGETLLDEVGPVEVRWQEGGQIHRKTAEGSKRPLDDDADARLQLFTDLYEYDDPAGFQQAVIHNLRCQIRDCYIRCGIAPPEDVRVQGPGFYENVSWYEHLGFYEPYNDPRKPVDTWLDEHTPEDLLV